MASSTLLEMIERIKRERASAKPVLHVWATPGETAEMLQARHAGEELFVARWNYGNVAYPDHATAEEQLASAASRIAAPSGKLH